MKPLVCWILCCWTFLLTRAQVHSIPIATDKTTSLIFPFAIRHVDRGTKEVLVQQVAEADNILLVKAAKPHFPETNLSIVTSDGSVYSFLMQYSAQPDSLTYTVPAPNASVSDYARSLRDNPRVVYGIRDKSWEITLSLWGMYVKDGFLYYQLLLENRSALDYRIDGLHFFIRNRVKARRTAIQERELQPVYTAGNLTEVKAHQQRVVVVVLKQFTLPDAKYLAIEIGEQNGGRGLRLSVSNKKIMKAIALPDYQ